MNRRISIRNILAGTAIVLAILVVLPNNANAALVLTKYTTASTNAGNSVTTGSFTPTNNSLLVVAVTVLDYDSLLVDGDIAVSGGSLTWTRRKSVTDSGSLYATEIWTAPVSAGASMTVSVTSNSKAEEVAVQVLGYTGYNTSSPIGVTGSRQVPNGFGPAKFEFSLSGAPASNSAIIAAIGVDTASSVVVGTGWNEQYRTSTTNISPFQTQTRTASTSASVYWDDVDNAFQVTAVAVEIKAATTLTLSKPPNNLGLNGYWKFDEGAGTVARDSSTYGNNFIFAQGTSDPTWVAGKYEKGLAFDATNDSLSFAHTAAIDLTTNMTISLWVKKNSLVNYDDFVTKVAPSNTLQYTFVSDGTNLEWGYEQGGNYRYVTTTANLETGRWYHVAVTWDDAANDAILFIDGVPQPEIDTLSAQTNSLVSGVGNFIIGEAFNGEECDCTMDEIRIYSRTLRPSEIKNLYQSTKSGVSSAKLQRGTTLSSGLVGHWTFDGPDVTDKVYDRSGQSNHGYFYNGATSSAKVAGKLGQALNFTQANTQNVEAGGVSSAIQTGSLSYTAWIKSPVKIDSSTAPEVIMRLGDAPSSNDVSLCFNQCTGAGGDNGDLQLVFIDNIGSIETIASTRTSWDANTWYFVAATIDTANHLQNVYINGAQDGGTGTRTGRSTATFATHFHIGSGDPGDSVTSSFNGSIDDVRVYNRVLTAAEIKQLYNLGAVRIRN